jgi:flavodoxin-like protein
MRLEDVISVRALVVYESMYGNTHVIAGNIADGLRGDYEVTLVPVAEATWDLVSDADLLVAGAPTHMHGLSSRSTRRMAAQAAAKAGSGLQLAPDADGPGMQDWLRDLGQRNGLAAAFDTRINGVPAFTGRAGRPIARLLKRHGYRLIAAPESFVVGSQNTLLDGEAARARRWGMTLGAMSRTYLPAPA